MGPGVQLGEIMLSSFRLVHASAMFTRISIEKSLFCFSFPSVYSNQKGFPISDMRPFPCSIHIPRIWLACIVSLWTPGPTLVRAYSLALYVLLFNFMYKHLMMSWDLTSKLAVTQEEAAGPIPVHSLSIHVYIMYLFLYTPKHMKVEFLIGPAPKIS